MARDGLRRIRSHTDRGGRALGDSLPADRDGSAAVETDSFAVLLYLSHEIRTPLNSMLALSQLLRDGLAGTLNSEQQKYVEVIERNGQSLIRLVADVLDLSRMELGRLDVDLRSVNLADHLRASAAALAPLARAKNIELQVNAADLPAVECDPERLRQILTNLIGNAIKFTHRGRVSIETEVGLDNVVVHVCDTGVGIPEAARSRVFDEFFQVRQQGQQDEEQYGPGEPGSRSRSARRGAGVGLGLAITRRLVRLMGGELSVESTEAVGSRFTFSLPIAHSHSHRPGDRAGKGERMGEGKGEGPSEKDIAIGNSERAEDVASATHRFRDESHGTNTAG